MGKVSRFLVSKKKTSISFSVFLFFCLTFAQNEDNHLAVFTKWLEQHGSKFRCKFNGDGNGVEVIADRRIHDRESVFMIPQSLLINSTVVDSSPLGLHLESLSLTEASISQEKDHDKQNILHIAQLSLFVLYGLQSKDDTWLPYYELLMKKKSCDVLWMWTDKELVELQDTAFSNRAKRWREEIHELVTSIYPKLQTTGLFSDGLQVDNIKHVMCIVQSSSFNVTSASGQPVRTLIPGLNLFTMRPDIQCSWWVQSGALRYRYDKAIEKGDQIYINLSPSGDSTQTLFEYGLFVHKKSKFVMEIQQMDSRLRRRFMSYLKIRKKIKYSDKFTFKSAALPYFRVQALSEIQIENLTKEISENATRLQEVKKVMKSPSLHVKGVPYFTCKDEVVALNTMAVHLREEIGDKSTSITEDQHILSKAESPSRLSTAVAFRLRFKKVVTHALDITSRRSIETKRECLSRPKDEL